MNPMRDAIRPGAGPVVWAAVASVALASTLTFACWALIRSGWRLKA